MRPFKIDSDLVPNHMPELGSSECDNQTGQGLNEPARPVAARPVSRDTGGQAAGGSAVRTERRGQDRRKRTNRRP
jgi:hypothetical protein